MSGCTVHLVTNDLDAGPIVLQRVVPVLDDDTTEALSARILAEEHKALPDAIRLWAEGRVAVDGRRVVIRRGGVAGAPPLPRDLGSRDGPWG